MCVWLDTCTIRMYNRKTCLACAIHLHTQYCIALAVHIYFEFNLLMDWMQWEIPMIDRECQQTTEEKKNVTQFAIIGREWMSRSIKHGPVTCFTLVVELKYTPKSSIRAQSIDSHTASCAVQRRRYKCNIATSLSFTCVKRHSKMKHR